MSDYLCYYSIWSKKTNGRQRKKKKKTKKLLPAEQHNDVQVKLAWINSLDPHRGVRADGEAVSILSSKDGDLHRHTDTQRSLITNSTTQTLLLLLSPTYDTEIAILTLPPLSLHTLLS